MAGPRPVISNFERERPWYKVVAQMIVLTHRSFQKLYKRHLYFSSLSIFSKFDNAACLEGMAGINLWSGKFKG